MKHDQSESNLSQNSFGWITSYLAFWKYMPALYQHLFHLFHKVFDSYEKRYSFLQLLLLRKKDILISKFLNLALKAKKKKKEEGEA